MPDLIHVIPSDPGFKTESEILRRQFCANYQDNKQKEEFPVRAWVHVGIVHPTNYGKTDQWLQRVY
jgi:hypothetical protein